MENIKNSYAKTIMIILLAVIIGFTGSVSVASAGTLTATNGNRKFNSDWQASETKGDAKITYGFNKTLIDEDYVWAKHSKSSHYASIYQAYNQKWYNSSSVTKGKTAKLEIKHKGSTIKYRCSW